MVRKELLKKIIPTTAFQNGIVLSSDDLETIHACIQLFVKKRFYNSILGDLYTLSILFLNIYLFLIRKNDKKINLEIIPVHSNNDIVNTKKIPEMKL